LNVSVSKIVTLPPLVVVFSRVPVLVVVDNEAVETVVTPVWVVISAVLLIVGLVSVE